MYQILEIKSGADRWTFVAHGARYTLAAAEEMKRAIMTNGRRAMLVLIPMN